MRVADEIVDGGGRAGSTRSAARRALDELEAETDRAMDEGFSTNLVVHAFALTAREVGFGQELTAPFFESMRMDLQHTAHDQASFERYVYGSAEVVGPHVPARLPAGRARPSGLTSGSHPAPARLGAAFQKVNFLRDLAADYEALGRSYFPGVDVDDLRRGRPRPACSTTSMPTSRLSAAVVPELPPIEPPRRRARAGAVRRARSAAARDPRATSSCAPACGCPIR